ncbi:MAG: hypothetical protein ABI220_04970 [Candidatus Saccharimonadales bacterium]
MKKKDWGLLAGVLVISIIISVVLANVLFSSKGYIKQEVEVVDPISADFPVNEVKPKYFNKDSVNPKQLIHIGDPNEHPFADENKQ